MINSKLQDLKTPIRLKGQGPITIELTRDRGRLWINDSTHCLVRICMLPPESIVAFNPDTEHLDITINIPEALIKDPNQNLDSFLKIVGKHYPEFLDIIKRENWVRISSKEDPCKT